MDINKLKGSIPDSVLAQIPTIVTKFGINTPLRLAHFLSQCAHESGDFRVTTENLNYSADGLKKTFSKYFPGTLNETYARHQPAIANRVYANRMGNGDEKSGDGYKFRGRSYLQITGRNNYVEFSAIIGENCVKQPDLLSTKYALAAAAWFWDSRKINVAADTGATVESIKSVTKIINGGYIGLPDRIDKFNKFYQILS